MGPLFTSKIPVRRNSGHPLESWCLLRRSTNTVFPFTATDFTAYLLVSEGGLEPPRPFEHWHLKPARLPFRHSPEGRYDDSDSDQCIHRSFAAHLGIGACSKIINMSDSGSRVANPADLRDASRERLLAEIGLLQHLSLIHI